MEMLKCRNEKMKVQMLYTITQLRRTQLQNTASYNKTNTSAIKSTGGNGTVVLINSRNIEINRFENCLLLL